MPQSRPQRLLVYLMRRDLRIADNPILHELAKSKNHGFTHLLPLYIFAAQQIEVSGFIKDERKSPFPEARSQVASFWRCGPHRAKFLSESVGEVKECLERLGSGLCIRAGLAGDVIYDLLSKFNTITENLSVGAVWMFKEYGFEEEAEELLVKKACKKANVGFRSWIDEKYLIDDRDLPFQDKNELPDAFTSFRKCVEPLRSGPRRLLATPEAGSLPIFPEKIPPQQPPFSIPSSIMDIQEALLRPLKASCLIKNPPSFPADATSSFPLQGGCLNALDRLRDLLLSSSFTTYHDTRNGLLGVDYSTKLSAYLALGCITSRQIHHALLSLEDGTDSSLSSVKGFGAGENSGTKATRFELLWRDYMRLCTRKFGLRLFMLTGFQNRKNYTLKWHSLSRPLPGSSKAQLQEMFERFLNGTTGIGLIDAAMRELYHTGFTSNRTRQNVASFLAKHLILDWRIGAEWYESMLVDYDVSSNWGNWQYVSGVGNDPRGNDRVFNPVKQAFDYDPNGEYIMTWCPELRAPGLSIEEIFQPWKVSESKRDSLGLKGLVSLEKPLRRIQFVSGGRGRGNSRGYDNKTGRNSIRSFAQDEGYGGRGYGSTRGHISASRGVRNRYS